MPYTHSEKLANVGDLPKHALLARIVEHLCDFPDLSLFTYVETHAGRAMYGLERKGEWKEGVSALYQRVRALNKEITRFPNLKSYLETCLLEPPVPGSGYPGSCGLVFQILKRLKRPYRFFLCDVDAAVCADLMAYFPQWAEVTVCRGNGLHVASMLDHASLVLLDPAYMETQEDKNGVLNTLAALDRKNIPVICWTPRVGPLMTSDGEAIYSSFEAEVSPRFGVVAMKWGDPEATEFWGCHLTVSQNLEQIAMMTANELREIMEWE
ncbi:MAG: 23S rRNA (adenine(2030)-N(6))-methyltransferase RlmJ [Desulfomonilaceae bacterium]